MCNFQLRVKWLSFLMLGIISFTQCKKDETDTISGKIDYTTPELTNDGWEVATLDTNNKTVRNMFVAVDNIKNRVYTEIHSLLIVHHGKLVFEAYYPGHNSDGEYISFTRDVPHEVQSASKSFRSALIGIAIDKGFISNVDAKLFSFFPEYDYLANDQKDKITLEHVLTMSSGLEWDEWSYPYGDERNSLSSMYQLPYTNWAYYVLSQPVAYEPGSTWVYSTGASIMLNNIIIHSININFSSFVSQYYSNLIESSNLPGVGNPLGGSTIPRDMAKLGYIYLYNGKWKNTQIISKDWVEKSIVKRFNLWNGEGYGYQWWLRSFTTKKNTYDAFYASGNGGQYIIVIKDLDLVIVFTGGNFNSSEGMQQPFTITEDYVLPAFEAID
ncbi:MAG TPA: serine hydrolase [Tenuifilaceae bacterium]|nr:serine hydrolase [Tenuifilaceae bacterium]